jgi:hypothetical protein
MAAPQSTLEAVGHKRPHKFAYLFFTLVFLMVAFPYIDKPGLPSALFRMLGAIAFLAAVYAVSEKRGQWITALVLWGSAGGLNFAFALHPSRRIAVPALISTILFLGFTLVSLLREVLHTKEVRRDTIYGAITVYVLIAYVWGAAYLLLENLQPGALALNTVWHPNHTIDWSDCMFFSFVTLTSVGYGDMVPITTQARSLSILEAVSGIMYVAVLVARLVGLYAAGKTEAR